jgi:ATP-dependent DNA helicase RecQ
MDCDELPGDPDPVVAAAAALLGVSYLYPYQRLVVANILEAAAAAGLGVRWPGGGACRDEPGNAADNREAAGLGRQLVLLPTGAGKSLCFQLPALLLDRPTLVLYPILSLMSDQARRLSERGFQPAVLRGGQPREEREAIWRRIAEGEARFIISNPETLLTESVRSRLPEAGIAHLVIDEAHCVSEWGESFRPSYLRVAEILEATAAPLVTAFTATASPEVADKIRRYVFAGAPVLTVAGNPDRPNIDYAAVGTLLRDRTVVDLIRREARPAVVFCSSRAGTERLARLLRAEAPETEARFYHAGLERPEKDDVERWFFSSRGGVLTATCAYGMGVDKADIRTVIHRDCPPNVEAYLQESGRAGRDGNPSKAILLWGPEDSRAQARDQAGGDRLARLLAYARDAGRCRRDALLSMLGAEPDYCPGCDVCRGEARGEFRERAALETFVAENRRRYSLEEAALVISENNTNGWTREDAKAALNRMANDGRVRIRRGLLWKGKLDLNPRPPPPILRRQRQVPILSFSARKPSADAGDAEGDGDG